MKNKAILLTISLVFMLALCGTVSATEDVNEGDAGGVDPDLPDVPEETDTGSQDNSVEDLELVDPIIGVEVNYEYPDDSEIIPTITVQDSEGNLIDFEKTYNLAHEEYEISFVYPGVTENTHFKITVSAPGYETQEQEIPVNTNPISPTDPNFYGHAVFDLQATPNYRLGREATKKADQLLNFATADDVLCITTAGIPNINGTTSEDCLEGILNGSKGKITFGKGNLLMLRKTQNDPVDFAFIVRRGSALQAVFFKNGSLTPAYQGTFSENMSLNQWNNVIKPAFGDDAYPYVSLANAWAVGLSSDVLREGAFHGHICLGTISGYAMIETLLKYYPPGELSEDKEATNYLVIGSPGNSDDDVFVYAMDATPGKRAYVGYSTTDDNLVGFIRWDGTNKIGTLVIMRFNEEAVVQQFKQETNLDAYSSISAELKFNKWLVQRLQNNPESLVEIVYAFDGLTEEQVNYLNGGTGSSTVQDAHGLDMEYILSQTNLVPAIAENMNYEIGNLTPEEFKQIGIDAANMAKEAFANEMGIILSKDDPNLHVLTNAGYVRLDGQSTEMIWDGVCDVLGSRLSRTTLLPIHSALWSPLWFTFYLVRPGEGIAGQAGSFGKFSFTMDEDDHFLYGLYIYYDPITKQLVMTKDPEDKSIHDIGPACDQANVKPLFDPYFNNVHTIANAVTYDPPFDMLLVYLFHNHMCPGVSPSGLITDTIFEDYPLGEDEKYMYITTNDYCKDDGLLYLLGISPGAGTYFNQRVRNNTGGRDGILIIWNEKTQTAKVVILTYRGPQFAPNSNQLKGFIALYKGETPDNLVRDPVIASEAERLMTKDELRTLLSGAPESDDIFSYILGIPADRTLADLVPADGGSQDGNQDGNIPGGNTDGNQNGSFLVPGSQSGSGTGLPGSSVGDLGPSVNAASQVSTETGESGETGSSHEVSKVTPESEESGINTLWIAVGAVLIGSLVAIGFFKGTILGMLK
jgi:formylmethanofuran dehydrogenase subunit E-like metal-binding protein